LAQTKIEAIISFELRAMVIATKLDCFEFMAPSYLQKVSVI